MKSITKNQFHPHSRGGDGRGRGHGLKPPSHKFLVTSLIQTRGLEIHKRVEQAKKSDEEVY